MFRIQVALILLASLGSSAFALNLTPQGIYEATFEACSSVSAQEIENPNPILEMDKMRAGYFPSPAFNQIIVAIKRQSFREAVTKLNISHNVSFAQAMVDSSAFTQALNDCYGPSPKPKNFFKQSVLRADSSGKAFGTFTVLLTLKGYVSGSAKLLGLLKVWSSGIYSTFNVAQKAYMSFLGASLLVSDSQKPPAEILQLKPDFNTKAMGINAEMSDKEFRKSAAFILDLSKLQLNSLALDFAKEQSQKKKAAIGMQIEAIKKQITEIETTLNGAEKL